MKFLGNKVRNESEFVVMKYSFDKCKQQRLKRWEWVVNTEENTFC